MRTTGLSNGLLPFIILALVGWSIYRRTRPQQVRLTRTVFYTAVIVLISLMGLAAHTQLLADPLFVLLAPVALLAGIVLGWLMMRTITFWRDQSTGQVWMGGGAAYVGIWLATMAFRLGIDFMATGGFSNLGPGRGNMPSGPLSSLASDLLFLSVGLWLSRGYALVRRYRQLSVPQSGARP